MRFEKAMDEMIFVRVSREEKRRLVATARKRGVTVSQILREGALETVQRTAA
jgi:transposase-like protein